MAKNCQDANAIPGGLTPQDPDSPKIKDIAAWAVQEHNKKEGSSLVFTKAFKAESQVVDGVQYYIGLEAANGGLLQKYEAVVWEKEWIGFRELESFKPVSQENERVAIPN